MKWLKRLGEIKNPRNAWLLLRIVSLSSLLWLLLKLFNLQTVLKLSTPRRTKNPSSAETQQKFVRYTDFILARNIPVLKGACLKRSLILYRLFRQEGLPLQINFGVAKENGNLIGHSWLTLNGKLLFEGEAHVKGYKQTYSYSPPYKL